MVSRVRRRALVKAPQYPGVKRPGSPGNGRLRPAPMTGPGRAAETRARAAALPIQPPNRLPSRPTRSRTR